MEKLKAKDIVVNDYETISPEASVKEAAKLIFNGKVRTTGYKPFGVMVVDDTGRLLGMVSMFDILYHLRPSFLNYEVGSFSIWKGEIEVYVDHFKDLRVEQIMSTPVIAVAPDDDLMIVIDLMIKKKYRRIPVVDNGKIVGIVYLSDVFYHLCRTWLKD
ncbi:MAG TPA: CBS domain-containing protein [Desulfobacteraceae bacterium]|nr:CBS domain-containing protein [Desulfobacteraceae bacterium]HPJ66792.1 CBS domain-containing protein [Desulfobacteraceae bacterium]HPQ27002.1 CBS domain-containing protein [Desulfobacteraceae bacterium]